MMTSGAHIDQEWLSLETASSLTGKSTGALRLAIQRRKFVRTKKIRENGREYWVIHKDEITRGCAPECGVQKERTINAQMCAIPFETYDLHRREWEQKCAHIEQGLMMYRFKFEEAEKQLKLLPAPAEVVTSQLQEKDEALKAEAEYRNQLTEAMHRQEAQIIQLQANLEQARRPWWKKLFTRK